MVKYLLAVIVAIASAFLGENKLYALGSDHILHRKLAEIAGDAKGTIGIAVVSSDDTITVNNNIRYPMMSVFKLHQSLAIAHEMDAKGTSPDTILKVMASEIDPDTWSPGLQQYIGNDFEISAAKLLEYSLALSDNNASNVFFSHFLSPPITDSIVKTLVSDTSFQICHTESEMKKDHSLAKKISPHLSRQHYFSTISLQLTTTAMRGSTQ